MKLIHHSKWDAIGISASLICAVHCVALPLIFASLSFLGIEILNNFIIESLIITISLLVGSWALYTGFQKHRHFFLLVIFIVGMMILFSSQFFAGHPRIEIICKAVAASCIITAHILNWKYSKQFDVVNKTFAQQ